MGHESTTLRIRLLELAGCIITVLIVMAVTGLGRHKYWQGSLFLFSGLGLAYVVFRKRLLILFIIGLVFIALFAGLTAVFHPSALGILLTVGSAVTLYGIIRWHTAKYPNLTSKDWKTLFDERPYHERLER